MRKNWEDLKDLNIENLFQIIGLILSPLSILLKLFGLISTKKFIILLLAPFWLSILAFLLIGFLFLSLIFMAVIMELFK